MNVVTISGIVAGASELRCIESGRELLNFDIYVSGRRGEDPLIHIAYFPRAGDARSLAAGCHVLVVGALRHRRDSGGLFVAAGELFVLARQGGAQNSERGSRGQEPDDLWRAATGDTRRLRSEADDGSR